MQITDLLTDEDAVSSVISVILMVAITVVLAAIIGSWALGLGSGVRDTAPQMRFDFEYDESMTSDSDAFKTDYTSDVHPLTVTIQDGESTDASRVTLRGGTEDHTLTDSDSFASGDEISSGTSFEYAAASDDTVRIIWTSQNPNPDERRTATLATWVGPNA